MQNEFEKQVKRKIEELDLVPSTPVWKKIEEQIREKKDKRRMILWIVLGAMLLGGGAFWLASSHVKQEEVAKTGNEKLSSSQTNTQLNSLSNNPPASGDQKPNSKENTTTIIQTNKPVTEKLASENLNTTTNSIQTKKSVEVTKNEKNTNYNSSFALIGVKRANKSLKNKPTARVNESQSVNPEKQKTTSPVKNETPVKKITDTASARKAAAAAVVVASAGNKTSNEKNKQGITDKLIKDSAANTASLATAAAPRHHHSKWQYGFTSGVGTSALTNGLSFGSLFDRPQSFSFDATPSTTVAIPYVRGYVTAVKGSERKSTSFSFGFVMRKLLGRKLNISSGLNYAYYSTIIDRGNVSSGTQSSANGGTSNSGPNMFSSNGSFYNYVNQFHFIGLPVAVDIRPVRKLPVHVRGGLSVQQLVSTNALIFDQLSKAYKHDENAYQKTQVFSELGLNYSLRHKNAQLLVGPQLSYGLTKAEKVYPSRHLFSFGLNAQFLFSKK